MTFHPHGRKVCRRAELPALQLGGRTIAGVVRAPVARRNGERWHLAA